MKPHVFLINVSESPQVVLDQINNIHKFSSQKNAVVIHISKSTKDKFFEESKNLGIDFNKMSENGIFCNPENIDTLPGHYLSEAFISSFNFIKDKIDFDKVVLNSSNQMYFKYGLNEHLSNYKVGVHKIESGGKNGLYGEAHDNTKINSPEKFEWLRKAFGDTGKYYWSFHEGSFYGKYDFIEMVKIYKRYYKIETSEEQLFPTLFHNICENEKSICPSTVWMNIYCNSDNIESIELISKKRYEELFEKVPDFPTCGTYLNRRRFMTCGDYLYGIKRVDRDLNCSTRKYINKL